YVQFIIFQKNSLFLCLVRQFLFKYIWFINILFINGGDSSGQYRQLEQIVAEPIYLTQVTYETDVPFGNDEFLYLTNLHAGLWIDAQALKKACFYLEQRKIFAKISLIFGNGVQG